MPDALPAVAVTIRPVAGRILLASFAAALFASAFLLFSVQPVVSRLVLPRLGGSPAVWNTCVCFFQAALLLGYSYAHLSSTRLQPRVQVTLHTLVLAVGLAMMPLALGIAAPPAEASPVGWLLALLALTVGPPFVAIAATAPLLQVWFARTSHPQARDPYFLYAASNAGSLLALLGYPVLIETTLDLSGQVRLWSVGFGVTAAAVRACGVAALLRTAAPRLGSTMIMAVGTMAAGTMAAAGSVGTAERLRWVVLAFVPSALMLAVTTHITTDIASVPLFWMLPLAIYIFTFVLAFARRNPLSRRMLLPMQAVALAATGVMGFHGTMNTLAMLVPLVAFSLTAAVCHDELASRRPEARHLTGYFMLISVGGALGGLFNALLAPVLFPLPLEYPLLLVVACLLRPPPPPLAIQARENWASRRDLLLPVAMIVLVSALFWMASPAGPEALRPVASVAAIVLLGVALVWFARRRLRLALGLAMGFAVVHLVDLASTQVTMRSFFGVLRVQQVPQDDLIVLRHGTTVHGMQSTRSGEELMPFGYYHRAGPFGRFFAAIAQRNEPLIAVGVVGLGTGVLGCYAHPGEAWTFHEIDPVVERLARDERWFRFMAGCGNHPAVVLGDARVTLAAGPAARYDLLIIDAFSSDSVPVHLLTREALALYFTRLKPGGIVLFHVSNRYLDLVPVVARLAADAGTEVRHLKVPSQDGDRRRLGAETVAVALPGGALEPLAADGWTVPAAGPVLWTDQRSDILRVIRWR